LVVGEEEGRREGRKEGGRDEMEGSIYVGCGCVVSRFVWVALVCDIVSLDE
jgi:hypothetical protein